MAFNPLCGTMLSPMGFRAQADVRVVIAVLGAVLCGLAGLGAGHALAAPPAPVPSLEGTWRAGTTSVEVAIESWGGDCGQRPQASKTGGGGLVTLVQAAKELIIRGRDQDIRSDTCWSRNPSMRKQSSSVVEGVWTTRCRTAPNDPREEQGTYVLKVMGPDAVLYQDTSRYNWALNTSKCVATFTTSQTLARVHDGATRTPPPPTKPLVQPAAVPTVTPVEISKPDPVDRACKPEAPAHLALRPKRAEIEVGQRVCFRARVTDAKDCVIPNAPVEWTLGHSRALRGDLDDGCFNAARTTAEAEGDFKIMAASLGLHAEASVGVHSVDLSALIAKRMEGDAVQGFVEPPAPPVSPPKAVARIATRTVDEPPKPNPKPLWIAAAGVLLLLGLGVVALVRRKAQPPPERTAATAAPAPRAAVPSDRPRVGVGVGAGMSDRPAASHEAWICPLCRIGYPAEQKTCPRDGSALMPYAEFSKRTRETGQDKRKRCPKCGDLLPATSAFCGKDGASLVDI